MPQGMPKYAWMINGNSLSGENKPWILATSAGDYAAIAENSGGCADTSNVVAYRLTPVAEHATDDIFSLYPNPATERININVGNLPGNNASIRIMNMVGSYVLQQNDMLTSKGDQLEISVGNLPSGMYIVQVESEDKAYTRKFIKN
jgi:hypothetical protein